uniref:Uncharacterized protein n=1 Tax=Physcomitrium patens TaxID=3218 RepID=A0A2K1JTE8_PHYPA|nr:hypothetical protein PHYPA_014562 [Physcomitrium patens]
MVLDQNLDKKLDKNQVISEIVIDYCFNKQASLAAYSPYQLLYR